MRINLFEILQHVLLQEEAMSADVNHAIDNKKRVFITYNDEQGKNGNGRAVGTRYIEPYVYGLTQSGNPCLRAYQYHGSSYKGTPKWKLFRLDRIMNWNETDEHFTITPRENGWNAEEYNRVGDNSMSEVFNMVTFDDENPDDLYSPSNSLYQNRAKTKQLQTSTPPTVASADKTTQGAVPNATTADITTQNNSDLQNMLQRNMRYTQQEKEKNGFDINKMPTKPKRGPIVPNDGESIEDARLRRKRERDREWHRKRREREQMDKFDTAPIRSNKRFRKNGEEPLNDIDNV